MRRFGQWLISLLVLGWLGLDVLSTPASVGVGLDAEVDPADYRAAAPRQAAEPPGPKDRPLTEGDPEALAVLDATLQGSAAGCRWWCAGSGAFDVHVAVAQGRVDLRCDGDAPQEYCACLQGAAVGEISPTAATARRTVGCHGPWSMRRELVLRLDQLSDLLNSAMTLLGATSAEESARGW
ncbi:MAG: hypothetical protein KTR31_15110 [Myxococcales bacterium]|nr:hypothetical protein [Myxococcales bacterium]